MKYIIKLSTLIVLLLLSSLTFSQNTEQEIQNLKNQYQLLEKELDSIGNILETKNLQQIIEQIHAHGLPEMLEGEELVCHSAMCLVFSEEYKLAKWVVHMLTGEIINGRVSRSNDFRNDPLIPNAGVEGDYFIRIPKEDGRFEYDGFGYDRGHLAPSADFRWSETALSESYFYSNISPQTSDLNRNKWAEIEGFFRAYIYNNPENSLFIVTAPVLRSDLPRIERGVNRLPIPEYHYKIAVDLKKKIGVAFLMPQVNLTYPIDWYAASIDSIEALTGINFFANLTAEDETLIESQYDLSKWYPERNKNDVSPMSREELPNGTFNTVEGRRFINYHREVKVCGTVVSTHKSRKGNIFLNLDKSFPNQIFSITIWASDITNFSYEPESFLLNKKVCITGKISEYQGTPSMYLDNENKIEILR
ncbi:MAG: DNA/RNA non-specific endonuclease [Bacteroidales bacterium]|nr:DNA/RNA non-specific endonuclease [Bacteroidales bacterium]